MAHLGAPNDLGWLGVCEEFLERGYLLIGECGAHADRHGCASGWCCAQPGPTVDGHSLELRSKAFAPLLDEVGLVNDEVMKVTCLGSIFQRRLKSRNERFRIRED